MSKPVNQSGLDWSLVRMRMLIIRMMVMATGLVPR